MMHEKPNECHHNREELLKKLTTLDFMLIELGLYLNTHPEDQRALMIHREVAMDAERLRDEYEHHFAPLCNRTQNKGQSWQWINEPWPWQEEANFSL